MENKVENKVENKQVIDRSMIYGKALAMVKVINKTDAAFRDMGVNLEFDDEKKPIGKTMRVLFNNPKEIVCDILGMELRSENGYCKGPEGHLFPIALDVYYPKDAKEGDINFSITFEEMWDLIDKAAEDLECAKKVWGCFVNRKEEDKEWLKNKCNVGGWAEDSEE